MKRHRLIGSIIIPFAVVGSGCAVESTASEEDASEEPNVVLFGIDEYGDEGQPSFDGHARSHVEKRHASCQGCGPVPDPWKSIVGPVPDPWDPDRPADPPANDGSAPENRSKRKR